MLPTALLAYGPDVSDEEKPVARHRTKSIVALASAYEAANIDETIEFTLPEDLSTVADDELASLLDKAVEAFDVLDDSEQLDQIVVENMTKLADAAESIRSEQTKRAEDAAAARAAADELRTRMKPVENNADPEAADAAEGTIETDEEPVAKVTDEAIAEVIEQEKQLVASTEPISIKLTAPRRRSAPEPVAEVKKGLSLVAAADLPGLSTGSLVSVGQVAQAYLDKTRGINYGALRAAASAGKRTVQSFSLGSVVKEFPADLQVTRDSDSDAVLKRAVDTSRLPGGSLVASAGWCSPSEVLYNLAEEAETTDGLFSLPEVQVPRGGLKHTLGPDFQSIFIEGDISWNYTEAEVEAGDYDGYGGGTKPCYFVPCPEFTEDRLDVAGVCIRAGLLQNVAYPETIERLVRGSLVAHEFKQAARKLARIVAGSTAVAMPATPLGATAPILDAIELQVEDYKQRHRVGRGRSLEAVFPYWVRGAIRSDLAKRQGVDMLSVANEQIAGWFAQRGVNAQFVYELDDLTGAATARTAWPDDFKFLLYLEGTWIGGTQAVITLESVFDSALVEQNIYTQLFTEEGWLVAKRFHDSRVVTVTICPNGDVNYGSLADCNGTKAAAE